MLSYCEGRTFCSSYFFSFFLVLLASLFFWDFTAWSTTKPFKFSCNTDVDAAVNFSFGFNWLIVFLSTWLEELDSELATGLSVSIVDEQDVFKVLLEAKFVAKVGLNACLTATFVFRVFDSPYLFAFAEFWGNFGEDSWSYWTASSVVEMATSRFF